MTLSIQFNAHAKYKYYLLFLFCLLLQYPAYAEAYIGPGAGFAFVSSFFVLFITFTLAFLTLLTWPIRWVVKAILRLKRGRQGRVKRVVIVGLDGQDPELTESFMEEGILPNFEKLQKQGTFSRLHTSLPAESPVAWSSFQTGCNPGKHRIYDFLVPNRKSLLPELSSANVTTSARSLKIGKYRIPLGKPRIQVGRKSQPFWKILGDFGVFSTIIRVPITFPPEKFNGVMLSAMCVPDVKGSQGTYYYYTSDSNEKHDLTSGIQMPLELNNGTAKGMLSGPQNTLVDNGGELQVPFKVKLNKNGKADAKLIIEKEQYPLITSKYTPWLRINYKPGLGMKVRGVCRFLLLETSPHVKVYVTPIQIDPEKPALPISYPITYSIYLAKSQGTFATLGVAEDTSALNENIIDEEAFLQQCDIIHEERERMFFDALEKTTKGSVVCVFDITDRLQHMFFRFLDKDHPANRNKNGNPYGHKIRELYKNMDSLIGRVMDKIGDDTTLMVMSDHGFKPFRRGVNLNAWLKHNGYLSLKEDAKGRDMLQDVDWSKTKAYAVGFGGIYLNMAGRESQGIVKSGEEERDLKIELTEKLLSLYDEQNREKPIVQAYDRYMAYKGPYVEDAPDLVVGFRVGYRAAWECVTGGIGNDIFQDNERPWSGDHNMNPADVPGMLFCNRPIAEKNPHIQDIAPTVLDLFGVPIPKYFDGVSLMPADSTEKVKNNKDLVNMKETEP